MKEFLDMHSAPGGGKSNAVRAGVSSRTGRAVEHRIRRTDHEQPDLHVNRTHQWVGVHKYVPGMYGSFIPYRSTRGNVYRSYRSYQIRVQCAYKPGTHITLSHPVYHYCGNMTQADYSAPVDWSRGNLYRSCRSVKTICVICTAI